MPRRPTKISTLKKPQAMVVASPPTTFRHARYLFTSRRRIVLPHRLADAMAPMLREVGELFDAIGEHTGDTRWAEASTRFGEVLEVLRRPSELFFAVQRYENELDARAREELERALRLMPRKGQVWLLTSRSQ